MKYVKHSNDEKSCREWSKWKKNVVFEAWNWIYYGDKSQWKSEIKVIEKNCTFEVAIKINFAMEVSNEVRIRETTAKVAYETKWVAIKYET